MESALTRRYMAISRRTFFPALKIKTLRPEKIYLLALPARTMKKPLAQPGNVDVEKREVCDKRLLSER